MQQPASNLFSQTVLQFLAPIRDFLEDDHVSEVMINGPFEIYVERRGQLTKTDRRFDSAESLNAAIRNISQFVGRRLDQGVPYLDARLPDGSRVHAINPPCARGGPYMSIRRFTKKLLTLDQLVASGSLTPPVAEFLKICVQARRNLLVAGGTGSGKTTLLNLLSAFTPAGERVITIEDSSELQLKNPHVLGLESRPPDKHGQGEVTIRDLVACSLRLRPDRIIVGEVRRGEALDMIQAMNTGHSGSMTTLHANSCKDALHRLETLALMAGLDMPLVAVRAQVASAVEMLVHISRLPDGSRRLTEVSEVLGLDDRGDYRVKEIFVHHTSGVDAQTGRLLGQLRSTGRVPTFWRQLAAVRRDLPPDLFGPPAQGAQGE